MGVETTRVIVAVDHYWLVGCMELKGGRIQDVLNDVGTEFIRLYDVQIAQCLEVECIKTASEIVIPKGNTEFVIGPQSQHEAPSKRFNLFTTKAATDAFVIVGGYCIRGQVHLPTTAYESYHALANKLGRFFPVTDVSIRGMNAKHVSAPLLFANRDSVNCFCVGESAKRASVGDCSPNDASDSSEEQLSGLLEDIRSLIATDDLATVACGAGD